MHYASFAPTMVALGPTIKLMVNPFSLLTCTVSDLDAAKRPKLEAHQSTASNGTASSGASVHGDTPTGRTRVESSASSTSQWPAHESQPSPQLTGLKKLSGGVANSQGSPNTTSPTVLPAVEPIKHLRGERDSWMRMAYLVNSYLE